MRWVVPLAFVLVAACEENNDRCDISLQRDVSFTHAEANEIVTVRSIGPTCDKAVGVYVIADQDEHPLWSWSAPLAIAFGEAFASDDNEAVHAFLERWALPELMNAQAAPEWRLLAYGQTTLDQTTYEDIRARNLPVLCHFSGSGRETCVFWEPAAGAAGHLYDRNAQVASAAGDSERESAAAPQDREAATTAPSAPQASDE